MELIISETELRLGKHAVKLPPGVFLDGAIREMKELQLALDNIRNRTSISNRKINVVVSALENHSSSRIISASTQSLPDYLLPFNTEEHYYRVKKLNNDGGNKNNFLVMWVKKELVDEFKKRLTELDLNVVGFEFWPRVQDGIKMSPKYQFKLATRPLLIVAFLVLSLDLIVAGTSMTFNKVVNGTASLPSVAGAEILQEKIESIFQIKQDTVGDILGEIKKIAGQQIRLEKISVDQNRSVSIAGAAASESAVINFKNRLLESGKFKDIVLPLSSLQKDEDGWVGFSLSFGSEN